VLNDGELYERLDDNSILSVADLKCPFVCICNTFLHRVTYFHVSVFSVCANKTPVPDPHFLDAGV
jgi:hypothetical protein